MHGDRVRLLALVAVCGVCCGPQPAQAEQPAAAPATPPKKIDRYIPAHEQIGHFAVPEGFTVELVSRTLGQACAHARTLARTFAHSRTLGTHIRHAH